MLSFCYRHNYIIFMKTKIINYGEIIFVYCSTRWSALWWKFNSSVLLSRVKYTGLLALGCVGLLALCDLWQIVADLAVDKVSLSVYLSVLIGWSPCSGLSLILLYLKTWWARVLSYHFSILFPSHLLQLELLTHMLFRGLYLLGIPMLMSFGLFYAHFAILTNAGPGNAFVSQSFQNTLEVSVYYYYGCHHINLLRALLLLIQWLIFLPMPHVCH